MNKYFMNVYTWIIDPKVWVGKGPFWQIIGIVLVVFTIMQLMPDDVANGVLFCKEALWITLILDALWTFLVFVAPFITLGAVIAVICVLILIICAILSHNQWH